MTALEMLRRLQQRNDPVALLLVDHRMPQMNGVETLAEAIKLYPDTKRVLLTAYADTEAAIKAINDVQLNHYLLKPWDPPERHLYPVLDDLLDDWARKLTSHRLRACVCWDSLVAEILRYARFSGAATKFRFNGWMRMQPSVTARSAGWWKVSGPMNSKLPLVFFPNGDRLQQPDWQGIATKLGLQMRAGLDFYDVAIVGGRTGRTRGGRLRSLGRLEDIDRRAGSPGRSGRA